MRSHVNFFRLTMFIVELNPSTICKTVFNVVSHYAEINIYLVLSKLILINNECLNSRRHQMSSKVFETNRSSINNFIWPLDFLRFYTTYYFWKFKMCRDKCFQDFFVWRQHIHGILFM